jgi:predicted dehydrogenase
VTTPSFPNGPGAVVEASFLMGSAPFDLGFQALAGRGTLAYRYSPHAFALHGLHGDAAAEPAPQPSLVLYEEGAAAPTELFRPGRDAFEVAIEEELAAFARGVREGDLRSYTGEDARLALSVSLASLRSCETGEPVVGPFR